MALYDNKYWLLSHIRNSFLSTDDTGMCELIMLGEDRKHLKERLDFYPNIEESEEEDDLSHESYDLQLDLDFGIRYRSNTAVRLEKMDQLKKRTSKIKNIKWEMNKSPILKEKLDELFIKKNVKKIEPKTSLFSTTFKQYTNMPRNPFIEYSRYDGCGQINIAIKKYRIFLTMLPERDRNYPLGIICLATAKIQDLIGLILLKCSTNYEDYTWKPINCYGLYITEEDGKVDRDFPCLDAKENIAKFGFTCLGLVEHEDSQRNVNFQDSEVIAVGRSFEENIDRRSREQLEYYAHLIHVHNKAMEAPLYKSYKVYLITKKISKIEIHLGISEEKIEIDPIQYSKFTLVKHKSSSHYMDTIAFAELIENKNNKANFKVYYAVDKSGDNVSNSPIQSATTFKHYDFESKAEIAEEIVKKINSILELRSSESQKEFLAAQERELYKNKSFKLKNL